MSNQQHEWELVPISPRPMASTGQLMCHKVCKKCGVVMNAETDNSLCDGDIS